MHPSLPLSSAPPIPCPCTPHRRLPHLQIRHLLLTPAPFPLSHQAALLLLSGHRHNKLSERARPSCTFLLSAFRPRPSYLLYTHFRLLTHSPFLYGGLFARSISGLYVDPGPSRLASKPGLHLLSSLARRVQWSAV